VSAIAAEEYREHPNWERSWLSPLNKVVYPPAKVEWFDRQRLKLTPPKMKGLDHEQLLKDTAARPRGREMYQDWQAKRTDLLLALQAPKERLARAGENLIEIQTIPVPHAPRTSSRAFGKVVHALLEDGDPERGAKGYAKQFGLALEDLPSAIEAAKNALNHDLTVRANKARRAYRELPIAARLPNGDLIEGRLDLAFETEEGWTIVDYKTGRVDKQQLRSYALALHEATGKPVKAIVLEL
jgi:ATP-dependent exoDNAse (exonuclease V) beta subunit